MSDLIKDWGAAKTQAERAKLIKKYGLQVGVSKLRPGEVKLGIANELKMNPKKEIPALDGDGELIIISGNPPKIKYPMPTVDLPEALSKDAKASEWIHDFVTSKNPKFAGKTQDQRVKMALAAYYAAQNESLDEAVLEAASLSTYEGALERIKNEIPSYADPKILPHVVAFLSTIYKKSVDVVKKDLNLNEYLEMGTDKALKNHVDNTPGQKLPVKEDLESEWINGSIQKRKELAKKHNLQVGISSVRPGEVKLGIANELNGKKDVYALDGRGKLIVVSGTSKSPKVRYVKENKEETIKSIRNHAAVELATGEKNPTIREAFLESGKADLTSTLKLVDSFKTFVKESALSFSDDETLEVHMSRWDKGDPVAFIKHHKLENDIGFKKVGSDHYIFTGDKEAMIEFLKAYDDGATDFTRNSEWTKLMSHYGVKRATAGFPKVAELYK